MAKKQLELPPTKESSESYEAIEQAIKDLFLKEIYLPLAKLVKIPKKKLSNSNYSWLEKVIGSGLVQYSRGRFTGKFSARTSKQLKDLGAEWDKKTQTYKLPKSKLPQDLRITIDASLSKWMQKVSKVDEKIQQLLPAEIADKLKVSKLFDSSLWKVDKDLKKTFAKIGVSPTLTKDQAKRISLEYEQNMKKYVQNFTEKEIVTLRKLVQENADKGFRAEALEKIIEDSFSVSQNKAKFLARQETKLYLSKFKETRYTEIGVEKYKWKTVTGSSAHPVRPDHKVLDGKVFSWDAPPITDETTGSRNNPGEDFNCRCYAIPIVEF